VGLPVGVVFDPIAQAQWGLSGKDITLPSISALSLITDGFLFNQGDWAFCGDSVSTTWTAATPVSTTWTAQSSVNTTWTKIF
jgi:hypothetical protein